MIIGFLFTFFFVNIFAIMIFANEVPSSEDKEYGETKNSIDKYIDGQLDKLDINEIQDYINKEIVINDVNLKSFVKDLISGEKNILDLFNKDGLKILMFDEFKASLKVVAVILVLALLSSILKSLENSFSSGAVSQIATYIIFITMVSLTLIGFKDVLQICYDAIDHTVGLMQVIMPILITFLLLIGFPITSTTLNPIFIGGVTFINVFFKKFSICIYYCCIWNFNNKQFIKKYKAKEIFLLCKTNKLCFYWSYVYCLLRSCIHTRIVCNQF